MAQLPEVYVIVNKLRFSFNAAILYGVLNGDVKFSDMEGRHKQLIIKQSSISYSVCKVNRRRFKCLDKY